MRPGVKEKVYAQLGTWVKRLSWATWCRCCTEPESSTRCLLGQYLTLCSVCLSRWSQSLWSVFVSTTVGASLVSSLEGVGQVIRWPLRDESQNTADCWEMVFIKVLGLSCDRILVDSLSWSICRPVTALTWICSYIFFVFLEKLHVHKNCYSHKWYTF